tara:strand:- start:403 stop:573 length:171 start_codon:yes stop_codon:yes gene_type:complete
MIRKINEQPYKIQTLVDENGQRNIKLTIMIERDLKNFVQPTAKIIPIDEYRKRNSQ